MDHNDDLIEYLLAVAGAAMEDASATALRRHTGLVPERLQLIRDAAEDSSKLIAAAEVIQRRAL